ncbi:ankyrin repeat domain-containing protein [Nonomuraea phyllanthi]|uniref:ankyrin repeat domain-containing protein n=1 Tax=Nonomuraea phyllanthi TaxID=2219224 RepID=UPI0012937681|nr:ankyrin repeat domain-containing protein [Nonomuraea phyllanthi]QFY12986.1 ankyrin repeat domain-containing protein [Nonomuraea phyllanthi]
MGGSSWADLAQVRARLDAGADPNSGVYSFGGYDGRPLHFAAEWGNPETVTELVGRVDDVDAEYDDRTALWAAVFAHRSDNARVLAAAGADPWRPMMAGWSPGRLALAGPEPGMFPLPTGHPGLFPAETAAVAEARRLISALGEFEQEGLALACVAGITAAEAARRLHARPADDAAVAAILADPCSDFDGSLQIVGLSDVPGGCVVTQPWGYVPATPEVAGPLSVGTVCYGMAANPKSGNQGIVARDGAIEDSDTNPGGCDAGGHLTSEEILAEYLYQGHAVAYCCAAAGLRLPDVRAVAGPPDTWVRLPNQDS